jgi:localization factor PodJL
MGRVPWHVKGVHPDAREVARDAARRSGLSVGEWLNSLIIDAATSGETASAGQQNLGVPRTEPRLDRDTDAGSAASARHADERRFTGERVPPNQGQRANPGRRDRGQRGRQIADSIARIERQIEGLSRALGPQASDRGGEPTRPMQTVARDPSRPYGIEEALAEITARQQALEEEAIEPPPYRQSRAQAPAEPDVAQGRMPPRRDVESAPPIDQQLRDIKVRIKALQALSQPETGPSPGASSDAIEDLRRDLAALGRRINDAMPPGAVASLEEQIQALSREVTRLAHPQLDVAAMTTQVRALASQISKLPQPPRADEIATALRRDLDEIAASLKDAIPHHMAAAIESQFHALDARIAELASPQHISELAGLLRHDLAEIGVALQNSMPQHAMVGLEEQVHALNAQIAQIGAPPRTEDIVQALRQELADLGTALQSAQHPPAAGVEEQLATLSAQIAHISASPPPRLEEISNALRHDLMKIGAVLHEAMPTNAIASLEHEVRALGERFEARSGHPEYSVELNSDIAQVRERLQAMPQDGDVAALREVVSELSQKADTIASEGAAHELLEQLEHAIAALHGLVSHVASHDAIDGLSRDIQALADRVDRTPAHDADMLMTLDRRLAEMADAIGRSRPMETAAVPPEFDAVIRSLTERLEAMQVPAVDPAALKEIETRIVDLGDKLDASQARFARLDGMERGIDDLMVQLSELRSQNDKKLHAIQQQFVTSAADAMREPAEAIRRDVAALKDIQTAADRRTHETFEAVYGTIEQVVDRLATIEETLRERKSAIIPPRDAAPPTPGTRSAASVAPPLAPELPVLDLPMPPAAEPGAMRADAMRTAAAAADAMRTVAGGAKGASGQGRPIKSDLPPDAPLEPGVGSRRVRVVANAMDRIAASEAANNAATIASGIVTPSPVGERASTSDTSPPARAAFVAAARRAAQAVANEQAGEQRPDKAASEPKKISRGRKLMRMFAPRLKSLAVAISVILLVLGALRLGLNFLSGSGPTASNSGPATQTNQLAPAGSADRAPPPAKRSEAKRPATSASPATASHDLEVVGGIPTLGSPPASGVLPDYMLPPVRPGTARVSSPPAPIDTTGSIPRVVAPVAAPAPQPAPLPAMTLPTAAVMQANFSGNDALPPTIGGKALISAAAAGDPGASFEIATRYAEGRHVPQDLAMSATWFDRAARTGMAPAQFRLGSMYEKGIGVKKDLQEARRLYVAAADQGHAKAMHNLAVMYAEGLDGKPDYATASQWFRKAAAYGVVDSQYNLAILFARGVGVERDMSESYKWFALAAKGGDSDAGKKRDEIATRLDAAQLEAAKKAVDSFTEQRQPDEATSTRAPFGGWDQVAAAQPAKPKAR